MKAISTGRSGVALALLFGAVAPVAAQDLVIVGGEVHSVAGPPEVADIVISEGRIARIEQGVTPGPDDTVIDASGMVVTPGLVDVGTSLGLIEIWAVGDTRDVDPGGDEIRAGVRAVDALNPLSTLVGVARREGLTSVVSHPGGGLVAGQSVWWDLGSSAVPVVARAPASMDLRLDSAAAEATGGSRAGAVLRYRELFADVVAWEANPAGYEAGQMRDLSVSLVDLEALAPVLRGEVPVMVSAHRQADILAALRLADEHGLDLIVVGGSEAWALADELAATQVPVVLDALANQPAMLERLGSRSDAAAILDAAGVPVVLSSFDTHRAGTLRQVAGNAVRAGLPHESALAAVTRRPAEMLGLAEEYGTLEVGRVANVVVWTGDPFELSTRARYVIVQGEVQPLTNRQTRLFERYRELPATPPLESVP